MLHGTLSRLFALVAVGLAAGPARAQIIFEFADTSGVTQSAFNINGVGNTVQVRVYLHELTAGAPELNSQGGLISSAVRVTYGTPGFAAVQNTSADVTGSVPPWAFFTTNGSDVATSAVVNVNSSFAAGVLPDSNGRILLGTFTFHGLAVGKETLGAVDPNPSSNGDTTHFVNGIGIDSSIIAGSAFLNVNPVPEPTTTPAIAALGMTAFARWWAARRRV
jgi:hypothetical protein